MKILVVFSNDQFVRNYAHAFDGLECSWLVSDKVNAPVELDSRFVGRYNFPEPLAKKHYALFNALMWKHRDRSPSFHFRYKRLLHLDALRRGKFKRFTKGYLDSSTSPIAAMFGTTTPEYMSGMPICESLDIHIRKIQPDLIIFPSSAYDPDGNDVARIGKQLNITTLFLIDNWDNLSSKTIFWAFPDHLGVWGPQSKEHAVRIQRFREDDVTCIGTPRFDVYRENPPSPYPFEYALFVGQAIPFDELSPLWMLEHEIALHGGPKIVYRPHPYRQSRLCDDRFNQAQFRHVVLDTEMNPRHYPALVKNARFVVATPTTMLIEALLCKKRVLLLAYNDQIHLTTPYNSLRNYEHFRGIQEVNGVVPCNWAYRLPEAYRHMEQTGVETDLSYYLFNDGRLYSDRLRDLVGNLIT